MLSETKLKTLKDFSIDFTKEEAIWASGFLAGLANISLGGVTPETPITAVPIKVKKISLVYGTETGNAKKLATTLAAGFKKQGVQVKLTDLSQYKLKDLEKETYFFVIISTQGEGEPPVLAEKFFNHIHSEKLNLSNLKFGVLGLGDSSYPEFCKVAEDVDHQLNILGGERLIDLQKCDVDFQTDADQWAVKVISSLGNTTSVIENPTVAVEKALKQKKNYTGKISNIVNLNDVDSDKKTFHIEIETNDELVYKAGDSLGIYPFNFSEDVEEILALTKLDAEKIITTSKHTASVKDLLSRFLNISYLSKSVVAKYADLVGQEIPETKLSLVDLLKIYPVPNAETFEKVIKILNPQQPRQYSISSSPEAHGKNEIHITVAKHDFWIQDEQKKGLCSHYLAGFDVDREIEFYIQPTLHFHLPSPEKDIILIGPGTGIAPLRSFLWERDAQGAEGKNWLFFGDRSFENDFLYQSEIQDFLKTGVITNLDLAFSRDQKEKKYVQHRLLEKSKEVYQWIENGASIYICGTKDPMSKDVEADLVTIFQKESGLDQSQAQHYLEQLELDGRLLKDVY